MSAVAHPRMKSGITKHSNIAKSKSTDSSTSLSSSDCRSNSAEPIEKHERDSSIKQSRGHQGSGNTTKVENQPRSKPQEVEDDFFAWVDPLPVRPPGYKATNPNRRVAYPVYDVEEPNLLPPYSSTVDEITLVSMKMEWLNPYTPSPSRGWKNFVMEINSTQLNFYHIDPSLTKSIRNYWNGKAHFAGDNIDPILEYDSHHSIFNSLGSKSTYQFNRADQESLTSKIKKEKSKLLASSKLFRSYSLQFAKFGIPTDYNRKTFVLRMRCETEQFLLSFSHVDDMIMWSVHLSIGIGVSLDLDFREFPSYRTVPRRRRRRRRKRQLNNGLVGTPGRPGSVASNNSTESRKGFLDLHSPNKKRSSSATGSVSSTPGEDYFSSAYSTSSSRRDSNDSIKFKLKSFFKSDKKTTSPSHRNQYNRKLSVAGLNSVVEDDEEDHVPNRTQSTSNTPRKKEHLARPGLDQRSQSTGLLPNNGETEDYFGFVQDSSSGQHDVPALTPGSPGSPGSINSIGGATIASNELQMQTGFHNNVGLQNDLNELHEIIREHNEDVVEDVIEDEEEEEESPTGNDLEDDLEDDAEDDDDDIDSVRRNHTAATSSIYQDEGIFHDSEDDYNYVVDRGDAFRRRASSVASNLSSTPYGSDGVKWRPPRKEMSRRRYIRDSLRCIRPLPEDEDWVGTVIIRPIPPPAYETNNPPVSGFIFDQGRTGKPKASKIKNMRIENGIILNKCKNHFVKPYVVGPVGLLKTNARC
ncbi:LADA_0D07690g1_1 [Lachancea dasiensis]|uniref:LADA_0D07690g1_1 n=1 Tax=Lachancea dasiensis TaxID=1072105 RepID=A0A1G4J6L4_9SACH|nr:LADA_0D07690g1_1 [Lachancea dasiensis]